MITPAAWPGPLWLGLKTRKAALSAQKKAWGTVPAVTAPQAGLSEAEPSRSGSEPEGPRPAAKTADRPPNQDLHRKVSGKCRS
jgi:hypothetical protein